MDPREYTILRELLRDRGFWVGSVDPRQSNNLLARRLGISRTTVWAALKRWERSGLLGGARVVPNPGLFDMMMGAGRLEFSDGRSKQRLLRGLKLHSGVVGAWDYVGPTLQVNVVAANSEAFPRWERLFADQPGVVRSWGFEPYRIPACEAKLSMLDWRLLGALIGSPDLESAATSARVTLRTATRRQERLLAANAMWYVPMLDYSKSPGTTFAMFCLRLHPSARGSVVLQEIVAKFPQYVEVMDDTALTIDPAAPINQVYAIVPFPSPGFAEDAQRTIQELAGVSEVELLFPRQGEHYETWFIEQASLAARRAA